MAGRWVRIATVAAALATYGSLAPLAAAADGEVAIAGFAFTPDTITIVAGDTVTWTNQDAVAHTATGAGFDVGRLPGGASGEATFRVPGTFEYVCAIHPNMKGTVEVTAATSGASSGSDDDAKAPPTDTRSGPDGDAPGPDATVVPALLALAGLAGFAAVGRRLAGAR